MFVAGSSPKEKTARAATETADVNVVANIYCSNRRSTDNPANLTNQTSTVDAIPPFTGLISQDGDTLIVAYTTTAVETVTYSNGDVWPEICHRSRVLIKLPGGDDDHDGGDQH
jgi:hypothetical protein